MNQHNKKVVDGLLVAAGSIISTAIAFLLYYLLFMLFETIANRDGLYGFVSPLRLGYAIGWLFICLVIYRTKLPEQLKAIILACSLTVFMSGIGVQLSGLDGYLIIVGIVFLLVVTIAVMLLCKMKKNWFHYFAISISIIAALLYLL